MEQAAMSFGTMMRKPAAFIPVGMSVAGLVLVLTHVAMVGAVREADEGTTAHLWQLLIGGQVPVMAFFAIQWLLRAPRQALEVLGVQVGAVLAAMAPVYFWNL
jgi:hypothetical protein